MKYGFGIIGCGLIGQKRADALTKLGHSLVLACDVTVERAQGVTSAYGGAATTDTDKIFSHPEIQCVIVATTNDVASPLAVRALQAGKHVLVEKPAGRNPDELKQIIRATEGSRFLCRIGFNHRFHPGLKEAKRLLDEGAIGPLMYIRARYGHGGRAGYDREWRASRARCGGGELLDQGVHLIDLCRWMGGEFKLDTGRIFTFFWDMPVEDNGFLILKSESGDKAALLHASCTEWKNIFDFEIFGKTGKLQVSGLGRSYGPEELRHFKRPPQGGVPELSVKNFPEEEIGRAHV